MRIYCLVLLISSIFLSHCDVPKPVSALDAEHAGALTGRWKQAVNFFSIGDATIHRQPLPDSSYQYLQFNADSTIETNLTLLAGYKKFRVLSDSTLQFSAEGRAPAVKSYSWSGDTLNINMHCVEPCGGSFVREVR